MKIVSPVLAAVLLVGVNIAPALVAPAQAVTANGTPQAFIDSLTSEGFAAMRSGGRDVAKAKFRSLLSQNVAVEQIGDRLIRRWVPQITPAQHAAYTAALPAYVVGTYADRLFEYSNATVRIVRAQPTAIGADVYTQVTKPGSQPIPAIWSVTKVGGQWKVLNLTVAGINVALAQAADFDSVIQRQGFDSLVRMMKARG